MICVSTLEMKGGGEMLQNIFFTVSTRAGGYEQEVEGARNGGNIRVLKLRI